MLFALSIFVYKPKIALVAFFSINGSVSAILTPFLIASIDINVEVVVVVLFVKTCLALRVNLNDGFFLTFLYLSLCFDPENRIFSVALFKIDPLL